MPEEEREASVTAGGIIVKLAPDDTREAILAATTPKEEAKPVTVTPVTSEDLLAKLRELSADERTKLLRSLRKSEEE